MFEFGELDDYVSFAEERKFNLKNNEKQKAKHMHTQENVQIVKDFFCSNWQRR